MSEPESCPSRGVDARLVSAALRKRLRAAPPPRWRYPTQGHLIWADGIAAVDVAVDLGLAASELDAQA
jgi:hypothetical protein